jgi:DNA (cytosine-5)-methyltransferase 1
MTLNYISLFSGIGCFEHVIHKTFTNATCLGYSEINPYAIKVYQAHYPTHKNLGDVKKIKERHIAGLLEKTSCHLVVAGFPCQDLSSLAPIFGHRDKFGLEGEKSGLFFQLKKILKWIWKHSRNKPKVIIENNSSMNHSNWQRITKNLLDIDPKFDSIEINGATFGLQRRNRIFWTNFVIPEPGVCRHQTWKDILLPEKYVQYVSETHIQMLNKIYKSTSPQSESYIAKPSQLPGWYHFVHTGRTGEKSRWQMGLSNHSDTNLDYARTITRARNFILIRKRNQPSLFKMRKLHAIELERLFYLPDGYVSDYVSQTQSENLLGNAIITQVIEYLLDFI